MIYLSPNVCIDAYVRIKHVCAGKHLYLHILIYIYSFIEFIYLLSIYLLIYNPWLLQTSGT